jgi:hypothetical protein
MVKTRIRHCQRVASNEGKTTTAKRTTSRLKRLLV